jgi:type II secretory pathway pseudopilin PulG
MNYEGYYLVFFIFIGLLIVIYYYNLQAQQQLAEQARAYTASQHLQYPRHSNNNQVSTEHKKTDNTDNTDNKNIYTYNIDNIDILNDNPNNNNNTLGSPSNDNCDPELEEVYNSTLRGKENHTNKPDEVYNYSIKPNKSDLPIVNPPLQLLKNNAPLRLSERHFL